MRWSNSPEIGLSSSFGHLFIPIEFFSPLTSARAQSTSWREIRLHPPFLSPGDLQQGDENDDQLLLGQLNRCRPHGHCLGTLSQVLREYSSQYFPRKTGHFTFGRPLTRVLFAAWWRSWVGRPMGQTASTFYQVRPGGIFEPGEYELRWTNIH